MKRSLRKFSLYFADYTVRPLFRKVFYDFLLFSLRIIVFMETKKGEFNSESVKKDLKTTHKTGSNALENS
jgi:hypothetical protein